MNDTIKEIYPAELNQWIKENKTFTLIDTLKSDTYTRRHLPTAYNACVFEVTFIDQVHAITDDKNAAIVLYGTSGRSYDSVTAAGKLAQDGYKTVYILKGGIETWLSEGFNLEGEAANDPFDTQTLLDLKEGTYKIDAEQSIIEWSGRNPTTTHFGTVEIDRGKIVVADGIVTGDFDINMDSIKNINLEGDELQQVLIDHLKSDDFFLTKFFPTARYEILAGTPAKEPFLSYPNYEISGNLELKGVKARQDFMATITQTPENNLIAEAHFDIDRTKWGIIYGSTRFFESLGMHMVFDLISLQIRVVAIR
ncbi:MAG: YceI family protein [Desulfobacterales bacterium]|nr:YceI family protein [Desulfobacterales bacterium]